ncbi:MAG: hypothetical protein ABI134_10065 [Byssovorax sp.]
MRPAEKKTMTKQTPPKQDDTTPARGAHPLRTQLDPDYLYTIWNSATLVAQIAATATAAVNIKGTNDYLTREYTEYWYVNTEALTALAGSGDINLDIQVTVLGSEFTLASGVAYAFNSAEAATWTSSLAAPSTGTNRIYSGVPGAPAGATAAYLLLNLTQASSSGPYSLTAVRWYLTGLTGSPSATGGVLQPGSTGGVRYSAASALPSSYWAAASL